MGSIVDVNWLHLDTSIEQARSRIDGREYPVAPLSADQVTELAGALDIAVDTRMAWALNDAVRASVRNLAAFFDTPDAETTARYERQRGDEFARFANDPARTILSTAHNPGAQAAHDLLRELADHHGYDPATTVGASAIGDLAAALLREKPPRADFRLVQGEAQLFDDITGFIAAIAPERLDELPSNEHRGKETPAIVFVAEFFIKVADRVRASFPQDGQVQERLDKLKIKTPGGILDGLRTARKRNREQQELAARGANP
ncbi:hypothetical protein [Aminobacter sp. AP02]|uniref:hypothetical protein n=1 Tax=Aminobacter sp. AP02 TaxID=2135737 RepID=UPI000D6C3330|nr:hypothetical protein [Aminobacter sp. AP02]